jgi:hypothetical protein
MEGPAPDPSEAPPALPTKEQPEQPALRSSACPRPARPARSRHLTWAQRERLVPPTTARRLAAARLLPAEAHPSRSKMAPAGSRPRAWVGPTPEPVGSTRAPSGKPVSGARPVALPPRVRDLPMKVQVQPARPKKGPARAGRQRAVEARALELEAARTEAEARPKKAPVLRAARPASASPSCPRTRQESRAIPRWEPERRRREDRPVQRANPTSAMERRAAPRALPKRARRFQAWPETRAADPSWGTNQAARPPSARREWPASLSGAEPTSTRRLRSGWSARRDEREEPTSSSCGDDASSGRAHP